MNEPWSRVLRLPFDEVVACVFEGQRIEDEDGAGATVRAIEALAARIGVIDNG